MPISNGLKNRPSLIGTRAGGVIAQSTMNDVTRKSLFSITLGPLLLVPALGIVGSIISVLNLSNFSDLTGMTALYLMYGVIGLLFAYPGVIIFGLPSMLALRAYNKFSLPILIIVSVIPASILFGLVMPTLEGWLFYGYSSVVVAVGCWYVFKWA